MAQIPDSRIVESACYDALANIGIRKKYGLGSIPINESFLGWIGLNMGRHDTFVRINPNVGVHSVLVSNILKKGLARTERPGEFATFVVPLGLLCPEVDEFIITDEGDLVLEAQRLAQTLEKYALPYMRSIADYESLLPLLLRSVNSLGGYPEKYAITLCLLNRVSEALEFLEKMEKELRSKNNKITADSLKKLKKFLEETDVSISSELQR